MQERCPERWHMHGCGASMMQVIMHVPGKYLSSFVKPKLLVKTSHY